MRKQFPPCKKIEDSLCKEGSSRHHKHKELSASASASIPQRKEEGARAKLRPILDSVRINTSAGVLCQSAGVLRQSVRVRVAKEGQHDCGAQWRVDYYAFKMAAGFRTLSLAQAGCRAR